MLLRKKSRARLSHSRTNLQAKLDW